MRNSIFLIALAVVSVLAYVAGQRSSPLPPPVAEDGYRARYEELEAKLQSFADGDMKDYLRLKEKEQQYQKADELLGKVMMIFLADLGLRVSKTDLDHVAKMAAARPTESLAAPAAPVSAAPTPSVPSSTAATEPKPAPAVNWAEKEKVIAEIYNENDRDDFLKSVAVDNLWKFIASAKPIDRAGLDFMSGRFAGTLIEDAPGTKPVEVTLSLTSVKKGDKIEGNYRISLARNGKVFSRSNGKGELRAFQSIEGSEHAVLVESSPDTYMHLYSFPRLGSLAGNFYKREAPDKFVKAGTVTLERR